MRKSLFYLGLYMALFQTVCADVPAPSQYYYVLKPSTIQGAGIGVFAAQDLPKGTPLFRKDISESRVAQIKDIPPMFLQYCIYINDQQCIAPTHFDRMTIGWYLNHSHTPNVTHLPKSDPNFWFYALRDIKAGEELVIDYNILAEPEALKEDYYKNS